VLCCAVLCCAVLCCAVLCCAVLCCAVLCCCDIYTALREVSDDEGLQFLVDTSVDELPVRISQHKSQVIPHNTSTRHAHTDSPPPATHPYVCLPAAVLCCAVLCCAVLCCAVLLCCAVYDMI
jgi:hypothetical protein